MTFTSFIYCTVFITAYLQANRNPGIWRKKSHREALLLLPAQLATPTDCLHTAQGEGGDPSTLSSMSGN